MQQRPTRKRRRLHRSLPPPDHLHHPSLPPEEIEAAIALAEATLGTPYRWNGRDTSSLPGLDCLGVIFRAYGEATGLAWRRYPVDPSALVASGLLGQPVPGLDGALRGEAPVAALARGDVLYFLWVESEARREVSCSSVRL